MESPNNTHTMLVDLGLLLKEKNAILEQTSEQIIGIKVEIREIMNDNKIKSFDDDLVKIKLTRSYTFDFGLFKMDNPELAKRFFTQETTTKVKDVFNKKELLRECPGEYKKCLIELTPRLRVT